MISIRSLRLYTLLILLLAVNSFVSAQDAGTAKAPLSAGQLAALAQIKIDTEKQAAPFAVEFASVAKEIYENMLADKEDERLRQKLKKRLHAAAGRLLDIKGQSFRDMLAVLTPEQKRLVRDEIATPGGPSDIGEVIQKVFNIQTK